METHSQSKTPTQSTNTPTQGLQIPAYVLDDLCSRFIINIPDEERQDLIRIFFQIELAHWFYLDFYCAENPELRSCGIKDFSAQVFKHCPFLSAHAGEVDKILENWRSYKMSVPTYGAIMVDPTLKYCLLVQGFWTKCTWGFPKGKVNEEEPPDACAVREVLEETGFDIENLIDRNDFLENYFHDQLTRLYIIRGVPLNTKFKPKTRKEIKALQWFPIDSLPVHKHDQNCKQSLNMNPNNFFMVIPFVKPLRKWVAARNNTAELEMDNRANNTSGYVQEHSSGYTQEHDARGGNSHHKQSKPRDGDAKQNREKQKQKLQQFFAQQHQNEFKEYMQIKDGMKVVSGRDNRSRSESPRKDAYQKGKQTDTKSPNPIYQILNRDGTRSNSSRRNLNQQFESSPGQQNPQPYFQNSSYNKKNPPLLGRDPQNTYDSKSHQNNTGRDQSNVYNKSQPRSVGKDLSGIYDKSWPTNKRREKRYQKITDPDGLGSEAWLNFKFDVNAIMSCIQ